MPARVGTLEAGDRSRPVGLLSDVDQRLSQLRIADLRQGVKDVTDIVVKKGRPFARKLANIQQELTGKLWMTTTYPEMRTAADVAVVVRALGQVGAPSTSFCHGFTQIARG